jgi:quercetin dioxygenase-like cupin family protein
MNTDAPTAAGRRGLKAAVAATLAVTGTLTFLAATKNDPPAPDVIAKTIAASTTPADMEMSTQGPSDVAMFTLTVRPGGGSRWHTHRGPVLVSVTEGTLTVYRASGASCTKHTYKPGQAVLETPGVVHITRNEAKVPLILHVVSILPKDSTAGTPQRRPADCHVPGKEV